MPSLYQEVVIGLIVSASLISFLFKGNYMKQIHKNNWSPTPTDE